MTDTCQRITAAGLAEIAEVVGVGPALRLAQEFGGQDQCYVPRTPRPDHPWVAALGWEAMQALCAQYGGERIDIPRNAFARTAKARMTRLKALGWSHRAIARETGCTERWVRMVLNPGDDDDDRQGSFLTD